MRVRATKQYCCFIYPIYVYLLMQSYMNLNVYEWLYMFNKLVLLFGLCYMQEGNLECI